MVQTYGGNDVDDESDDRNRIQHPKPGEEEVQPPAPACCDGDGGDDVQEKAWKLYRGVGLAPMVRASTTPLRALALRYGADFCYSEELVDRALTSSVRKETEATASNGCWVDYVKDTSQMGKKSKKKLLKKGGTGGGDAADSMIAPLLLRIDRQLEQNRLILQLGSGEPDLALKAALHVHRDVAAVDLNMGCPKKFSVSGGMGSALLSDPQRACSIVRTLSQNLNPLGKPVSVKIRLLRDVQSTLDFVAGLVDAGASAVAIHGRRVGDESTAPADRGALREVASIAASRFKSKRVPILINGDFYSRDDFVKFMDETGARGVLLARPALYNTSIFRKPPPQEATASSPPSDDNVAPAACCLYGYESNLLLDKTKVVQDYLVEAIRYNCHYKNIKYVVCEMMSHRRTPTNLTPLMPIRFEGGQTVGKVCDCKSLRDICQVWDVDYDAHMMRNAQLKPTAPAVPQPGNALAAESAAPAGEHKYLDSYFLDAGHCSSISDKRATSGRNQAGSDADGNSHLPGHQLSKKPRVDDDP